MFQSKLETSQKGIPKQELLRVSRYTENIVEGHTINRNRCVFLGILETAHEGIR